MIKKYKEALDEMGQLYGGEASQKVLLQGDKAAENEVLQEETTNPNKDEKEQEDAETGEIDHKKEASDNETAKKKQEPIKRAPTVSLPEGDAEDFAFFSANVFSGEETYPVEGAKVVVYRGDNIYAFLSTDENGKTEKIKLPAYNRENSLEEENPDKAVDYQADVFADGFNALKGLLVSAVGGSDVILRVSLVPEGERVG